MWSPGDQLPRTRTNPSRRPKACFLEIGRRCLSPRRTSQRGCRHCLRFRLSRFFEGFLQHHWRFLIGRTAAPLRTSEDELSVAGAPALAVRKLKTRQSESTRGDPDRVRSNLSRFIPAVSLRVGVDCDMAIRVGNDLGDRQITRCRLQCRKCGCRGQ